MTRRLQAVPEPARRGIGLVRVSKARDREDLTSPELQRTAIEDYSARQRIQIVDWVEVLDESGSLERSAWWRTLDQVVEAVEAGNVQAVVCWKYSRAARHRRRWAVALDQIEVAGGSLESATEQLDTTTSTGRFTRGMLAEIAAWEAERIGETWKETHARRRGLGLPHAGRPRFGYTYTREDGYQPDPETSGFLVAIFERFAAGDSAWSIVRWLNTLGVKTTRGNTWVPKVLYGLLDAGFGAGFLHERADGGRLIPGAHPAVIDAELWARVRKVREQGRRDAPWTRAPAYSLSGLVRCVCGKPMTVQIGVGRNGAKRRSYRCVSRVNGSPCIGGQVEMHRAEQAVRDWLATMSEELEASAQAAALQVEAHTDAKHERAHLTRQVAKLDRALVQLNLDRGEGLMPDTVAFVAARDDIEQRRTHALKALEEASSDVDLLGQPHRPLVTALLRDWDAMSIPGRRDALKQLVRRVVVHAVGDEPRVRVVPLWERDTLS